MHPFRTINSSLVTKTATLIFGVVSVLVLILILTSRELVFERFATLEQEDAKIQVQRVANEIKSTLDKLQTFGTDWGYWDDTFQFVTDHNPEFIENNLMNETFIDQRLNFMMFFNAQGQLVHQQFFNLINAKPAEPDISTIEAIKALPQLVHCDPGSSEILTGVILTPTAPLLLISSPVTPSLRNQPSRGRFLIGRYLNRDEIERISTLTQLNLTVIPLPPPSSSTAQQGTGYFQTKIVDDNTLLASTVLADIFEQPKASVQVTLPRTIFRQGYAMWKQHAVSAALLGFLFVVVLVLLLNKIVLQRLMRMTGEIDRIKEKGDPEQSVTVQGQDEIAHLAENINAMLETLQRLSQSQEEKEQYLQRVLDTINCGVMVVAAEDRQIVTINKAGAALLGHHPEDIIGRICHTFV
jgi:sensor domain CHASE-containing protein